MPAATPPQAAGQVQVPGTGLGLDLSNLSASIAAELAAGITDATEICARYKISTAQWAKLKKTPVFREMIKEALQTWHGAMNAGSRITKKAEIVIEDAIEVYDRMIHSNETPAAVRVEAGKFLAQLAGRTGKGDGIAPGASGGSGLVLNINIGERRQVTIEGTAEEVK